MIEPNIQIVFAKLKALLDRLTSHLHKQAKFFNPAVFREFYEGYASLRNQIMEALPDVYEDMPVREIPDPTPATDFGGRGYYTRGQINTLRADIKQILDIRSNLYSPHQTPQAETTDSTDDTTGRAK